MTNHNYLESQIVYFRDEYVPFRSASVSVASAPVQYGLSVYTACNVNLTSNGRFVGLRLNDHYQRLRRSANILGLRDFEELCSKGDWIEIIEELLNRNKVNEPVIVRANYFADAIMPGTRIHDLDTALSVFLLPFGAYYAKNELDVCVSSWRRVSDEAIPARAKVTGSYVNSSLMKSEAVLNGYDDCIAIDQHGHVAEGAVANIFMVRDGVLATPSKATDILEGITRDTILKLAGENGIPAEERDIDRSELYAADELFFSGSSARVLPIVSVDRRKVGDGKVGSVTRRLQRLYTDVVSGRNMLHGNWLHEFSYKVKKGYKA